MLFDGSQNKWFPKSIPKKFELPREFKNSTIKPSNEENDFDEEYDDHFLAELKKSSK